MSKERFQVSANQIGEIIVIDTSNDNVSCYDNISHFFGLIRILNELNDENEQLRTQLLICQQSKSDDGRFQVWEVPPIPKGMRITTFTTSDGEKDE